MGIETALIIGLASAAATGYSAYSQRQTAKESAAAQKAAAPVPQPEKPPAPTAQGAKAPDHASMMKRNLNAANTGATAGNSSTFLTGPSGVDPATLNLGKNTLLGQ